MPLVEDFFENMIRCSRILGEVIRQNKFEDLEYLTFPMLDETGIVKHLFSTRIGGVSKGIFSTMNLSFSRGDEEEAVLENYRRIARYLDCDVTDFVASQQTHTTNIKYVTRDDAGKGIVRDRDYSDIDGLITDEKGLGLVTYYADCVPLYFVDPENKAIGLAHSGWRGTANSMGQCMVMKMREQFNSEPSKLKVAIGPSICQDCYEVSGDVAEYFEKLMRENEEILDNISKSKLLADEAGKTPRIIEKGRADDKYQLNLWLANLVILVKAGVLLENISVTDLCTCHNPEYLFSHRASNGKRGNLAAFLILK